MKTVEGNGEWGMSYSRVLEDKRENKIKSKKD